MEKHELIESAARVIAAKGQRLAVPGNFDAARLAQRQQRSRALLQIAAQLSPSHAQAAGGEAVTITPQDRKAAANEVYSLLQRRAGTDIVHLYDIALELHHTSYWAYLRGLALQENGDVEAACTALEAVQGQYAGAARHMAGRLRQQAAGVPDEFEQAAQQLYDRLVEDAGGEEALQKSFGDLWASVTGLPAADAEEEEDEEHEEESDAADDPAIIANRDLAAETAQCFAERLVDGDFAGARALLGAALQDVSVDDLREDYELVIESARDGEEAPPEEEFEVLAMSVDEAVVDQDSELAYVYVAISGANFSESLTVTVAREQGEARITDIDWGGP